MKRLTVNVSDEQAALVERLARIAGRSLSEQGATMIADAADVYRSEAKALTAQSRNILGVLSTYQGSQGMVEDICEATDLSAQVVGGTLGQLHNRGYVYLSKTPSTEGWRTVAQLSWRGALMVELEEV